MWVANLSWPLLFRGKGLSIITGWSNLSLLLIVGTNTGAALVDLENQKVSWVLYSGSDVLAQQFDQSVIHRIQDSM